MANSPCPALTDRFQFLTLKKEGERVYPSRWLLMNYAVNECDQLRVGVTASRKVGSAVIRNRLKRWCREFFRSLDEEQKGLGVDVNVIFRPHNKDFYKGLSHTELRGVLDRAWRKAVSRAAK